MTRRILLVLLAFTAAVLVGAVVPLTLDAAGHDRASFIQATAGMARTDAAIAQSRLDALATSPNSSSAGEAGADAALLGLIGQTRQAGDGLLILRGLPQDGVRLFDKGMPAGNWVRLATQADEQGQLAKKAGEPVEPVTEATGSRVAAAMPVFLRGKFGLVGTVVLARSTSSLNDDVVTLWVILGTIAAVAMIGAALLAFGLAIVHRLVTSNGGMAKLTETPGGGLTAILEFPGVPAPNSTTQNNTGAEYPPSAQDLASL